VPERGLTRIDNLLVYAETHRATVSIVAVLLILLTAWVDWATPDSSVGFLYLVPIMLSAAALRSRQIVAMAALCGYLREAFDPLQYSPTTSGILNALNPRDWAAGSFSRLVVAVAGFAMTGFFLAEINNRRRLLAEHLKQLQTQVTLREEAERQLGVLIDTSPLAILTVNQAGAVVLSNESARQLLGFENVPLEGENVEAYLPLLYRMLHRYPRGTNMRTSVECRGLRRNGDVFLAHVWLSTYRTSAGAALAAVIWDASENLRDREGAGLNSMMATSRVLIGAMSHEIRNLASAAALAYGALEAPADPGQIEHYQALGSLIMGLEKIASSGLRVASNRESTVADLGTVLDEARIVVEPSLREADIEATWEIAPGLPLVQADHHSLLQVFVNLARNSQQALEHAGKREMHISATAERDLVVVRFRDSGPGVANPDELFRPFQPGAHSMGLGLYISRAILHSHGGGLHYEPEPAGACFAVELWPAETGVEA
jgi:two-component system, LuxR family, sensor kinase FixL